MNVPSRQVASAALLALSITLSGCGEGPTNGRPITGCPDGVADRLVIGSSGSIEHENSTFLAKVQRDDETLVLVDFWAPWCGPCRMLAPSLEAIKKDMGDRIEVIKVDTDQAQNRAMTKFLGINAIPDIRIFRNGTQVGSFVGLAPREEITAMLKSLQ